jgi:hypothetical protein
MAAGKSHWLKPREELIVAKGKGELKVSSKKLCCWETPGVAPSFMTWLVERD